MKVSVYCMGKFSKCRSLICFFIQQNIGRERDGVVVERRTPNREVLGSIPTSSTAFVLEQYTLTPYSTG